MTAVNDTLLPLSDSTMPARLGGELYVPYEVFSNLGVATSNEDGLLRMLSNGELLNFSTSEGYVYDQHQNSYSSPAYDRNDTVYVPVKLCCGRFGFGYSTISVSGETVLRITDSSAQSDSDFTSNNADAIESAINDYKGYTPAPSYPDIPDTTSGSEDSGAQIPDEPSTPPATPAPDPTPQEPQQPPEPPPVEETPSQKPELVYITVYGMPNTYTSGILESLRDSGRRATFFLPADDADSWDDDLIRRIAAEGHALALLLNEEEASPEALESQANAANDKLSFLTGINTRIVSCKGSCDELALAQKKTLAHAGYRLWDYTLNAGDDEHSAVLAYAETAQHFASTNSVIVLQLHHSSSTAETISELTSYMSRQGIPSARITFSANPRIRD